MGPQLISDPEASYADKIIQQRSATRNNFAGFGFSKDSRKAGNVEPPAEGNASPFFLINEDQIGRDFSGKNNCLRLTRIQLSAKYHNSSLVDGLNDV